MINKSYNLIGQEHFNLWLVKHNLSRYGSCTGKQRIIKVFHFRLLSTKMTKFSEILRKLNFGSISGTFCPF